MAVQALAAEAEVIALLLLGFGLFRLWLLVFRGLRRFRLWWRSLPGRWAFLSRWALILRRLWFNRFWAIDRFDGLRRFQHDIRRRFDWHVSWIDSRWLHRWQIL